MPFWKAALWAGRGGLRRLFEKAPAPARRIEPRAAPAGTTQPSPTARPKVRFPAWVEKLSAKLFVLKVRLRRKSEKTADLRAEIDAEARTEPVQGAKSILTLARQAKRSAASTPASAPVDGDLPAGVFADESVAAPAGDLNRLASLMRKKDKVLTPARGGSEGAGSPREASVKPEEAPVEEAKRDGVDLFDLVEPGDAEAVSMAVSKREALHKAQG